MGRKSLAGVRTEEILVAFERCIVEHGLGDSSLSRVAATAGVKTSLISHYFGNRAGLMEALCDRLVARYQALFSAVLTDPRGSSSIEVGIGLLFSDSFRDQELSVISRELVAASLHDPVVKRCLHRAYGIFEDGVYRVLTAQFPRSSGRDRRAVAVGLLCLADASVQLASYGHEHARSRARRAARALVSTLADR